MTPPPRHFSSSYKANFKGLKPGQMLPKFSEEIASFNDGVYQENLDKWFAKYGTFDDGHASRRVTERILDVINNPTKYEK